MGILKYWHNSKLKLSLMLASLLILLGLIGTVPALYFHYSRHGTATIPAGSNLIGNHLTAAQKAAVQQPTVSGIPTSITIPSLNMRLAVVNGYYNKSSGQWNTSNTTAQYATPSVPLNNLAGNTLVYGHYRRSVFENLHLMAPGSQAILTTDSGYTFVYKYVSTYATQPSDTTVFTAKGAPRLTVQTCSGAWFQNRQMYQFELVSYSKTA